MYGLPSGGGGGNYLGDFTNFDSSSVFDTYQPIDFAQEAANNFDASSYFADSIANVGNFNNLDYTYADLTPSYLDQISVGDLYSPQFEYNTGLSGLDLDFGDTLELTSQIDDFSSTYDPFSDTSLTLEEAGMIADIQQLDQVELGALEDIGLLTYNEDGSINDFDTNSAIVGIEQHLLENGENIDPLTYSNLLSTRNELIGAVDAGIDQISIAEPSGTDLPIGTYSYNTIEGEKYVDPMSPMFIPQGTKVAGPEGQVPFLGSMIASGINNIGAKKNYVSDPATNGGYVFPQQTQTIGQALNDPMRMNSGEVARAAARSRIAGDRYGFNEYGEPNQMLNGVRYAGTPTFYDKVDSFTDGVRDFGGMLLKPLNWVSDTVGGGLASVGQAVGDNIIGRGILNLGNVIDGSGDYLFGSSDRNSLLGTVMGVPDSVALMGQGLAYGNLGMAGQGLKGIVGAPLSILGNALSMPYSLAKDVFGADITMSARGGGGGKGKKKKKKQARKNVPIVGNKRGVGNGVQNQVTGTGSGEGGTTTTEGGTEFDLSDLSDRNEFAEKYGEAALAQRMSDLNLKSTGARGNADAGTLETSEADRSQVAESISANQGNSTGVRKAPQVESADPLDERVGPGEKVDLGEMMEDNATGFKTSDLFEDDQQPIFAYEGEDAFA